MPGNRQWKLGVLGGIAVVAGAALVGTRPGKRRRFSVPRIGNPSPNEAAIVEAAQRLNRAAGLISTSTLLDSAVEHYRGSFHNMAMVTPLVVSALTLAVSVHGTGDKRKLAHRVRDPVYFAAACTGLAGTCFHVYNVSKRPGGFSWQNLFYGSPLGAPAAVGLAGWLGYYSERLRDSEPGRARILGFRAGRALAALTAIGMFATAAEAGLLHFRGAYHDPFMYVPVTVPPIAGTLLAETALSHPRRPRRFTTWWLRLTALIGFLGSAFHAFGVSRNMGGWRNWRQNVLNGPPIPAPPSFTGLALAGLAAHELLRKHRDA
ncbi:MAG TPA: hypothetical protein VFK29_02455 [Rhodanobacteraceae bacterium]|nr:hypothetical protein [Rhodanobacteraceae bacterium]